MHFHTGGFIASLGGTYALLAAFRVVHVSKNPAANEMWLRKFGPVLKIVSPLVILFGLAELLGVLK
jgi:hypothetical protein